MKIFPGRLSGVLQAPPSKSCAHRAVLAAALARGTSTLHCIEETEDIAATIGAVRALGAETAWDGSTLEVRGISKPTEAITVDCCESGSTLRFVAPIVAALGLEAEFLGRGRLPERPMEPLISVLAAQGACVGQTKKGMLALSGQLSAGTFAIPGNISSQYITGLLFALPLLPEDSRIVLTTPLESKAYVDMTLSVLEAFGVCIVREKNGFLIPGGQEYKSRAFTVEGDYSSAAFWLCAGALGSDVAVTGLSENSLQGDRAVLPALALMGAKVEVQSGTVQVNGGTRRAIGLDVSPIPDLVPALAVVAAFAKGEAVFSNAARLRIKESDRIAAVTAGIQSLGGRAEEHSDHLTVYGSTLLRGGVVDAWGDHRIAMAAAIGALACTGETVIRGAECVRKSYPQFWEHFKMLGGICHVIDLG